MLRPRLLVHTWSHNTSLLTNNKLNGLQIKLRPLLISITTTTDQTLCLRKAWCRHFDERDSLAYKHHHCCITICAEEHDSCWADTIVQNWWVNPNPALLFRKLADCQHSCSSASSRSVCPRQSVPVLFDQQIAALLHSHIIQWNLT